MEIAKFTLKVPNVKVKKFEETISLQVKDDKDDSEFIVYPRIWDDTYKSLNYNLDWDRKEDLTTFRSTNHSLVFDNCIEGKEIFKEYYEIGSLKINQNKYSPPRLRMFENHEKLFGRNVILTLLVKYDKNRRRKLYKEEIRIKYDKDFFEVGFTDDGQVIKSSTFVFKKKFFKDEYYTTNLEDDVRKTKYEVIRDESLHDGTEDEVMKINNLIVKSKRKIKEHKNIDFFDKSDKRICRLVVSPNNKMIYSSRKIVYVKINRKNHSEKDKRYVDIIIKRPYIREKLDELQSLTKLTDELVNLKLPKLGIKLSNEFDLHNVEVDDKVLENRGILNSRGVVLIGSQFLIAAQEKYFKEKNINKDQLKDYFFVFISPLLPKKKGKAAFILYDKMFDFSALAYHAGFDATSLAHEFAHESGLNHLFRDKDSTDNGDGTGLLSRFKTRKNQLHKIYFKPDNHLVDNMMDYGTTNCLFDYQIDIIQKLNEEFNHI